MKICARCGGWVYRSSDKDGSFDHCINCGEYVDVFVERPVPDPVHVAELKAEFKEVEQFLKLAGMSEQEAIRARKKAAYQREYDNRPEVKARKQEYEREYRSRGGGRSTR